MTIYGKPGYGISVKIEFDVSSNSPASLRPLVCFAYEIAHFVHDLATHIEIEKLRSEGVAMYAYSVSV